MSKTIWLSPIPNRLLLSFIYGIVAHRILAFLYYHLGDLTSRFSFVSAYRIYQASIKKSIKHDDLTLENINGFKKIIDSLLDLTFFMLNNSSGAFECNHPILEKRLKKIEHINYYFLKYFNLSRIWKEVE